MFTKTADKLNVIALKAVEAKAQKEEEIKNLQTECNALEEATNMANKIRSLIS